VNKDWKKEAKSYSENHIFGKRLRTYYNEKSEIVFSEDCSNKTDDTFLKSLKRLSNHELVKDDKKKFKNNKSKKRRDEIKEFKKSIKKSNNR
tara:strand:+ start:3022 stop:3297 length:276 start_codon:yes stop_codon:yes gene_type:complete